MCGILASVGEYRFEGIPEALLDRGIDDAGEYVDSDIQLMQTRLQITGGDKIALPLQHEEYVLLFNGEIYNYKELNKNLTEFQFKYDSDFETALYGFIKWGDSFVDRLDGQYAIFIWNKLSKTHHIFTDPFKIKSVYKIEHEGSVIYSSNLLSMPHLSFQETFATGYGNVSNAKIL